MKHFAENVINQGGTPVSGASVSVFATGTQNLATIYSDDGITPKANPIITDTLGRFDFYVADGRYDLAVAGPTLIPFTLSNIEIADLTEAQTADAIWNTEAIRFANQGVVPSTPPANNVNIYTKAIDKRLYYKDDTGTEIGPLVPGGTTSPVNAPSPFVFNTDMEFKGPNPYVDIRNFGARASNPFTAPALPGITANISLGNPTQATISSASTFVNGDGVVIYGAGGPHSLSVPTGVTVQPALAQVGTGTGYVITANVPVGSLTTCYQVVAATKGGGLTAASPEVCTNVGNPLGAQSVNIASMSRAGNVVTVTTAAPHSLAPDSEVVIGSGNGLTDSSFFGWYRANGVPDNTHFTFVSGPDTRLGASASATGGTVQWFAANHISWNVVPNAIRYYIYAGQSGAETLYGVSNIQGSVIQDPTFDDFGLPYMANFTAPPYVPNTPPVLATVNNLSTTIVSGAGGTTLVLANAASTAVNGATIRLDATPAILAAATSISAGGGQGTLYIPSAPGFVTYNVNSYLDTSGLNYAISQSGALTLNETWQVGSNGVGVVWFGDLAPQARVTGPGAWQSDAAITVNTANPGIYVSFGNACHFRGLGLANSGFAPNNIRLMLVEGGFNQTFEYMEFTTGSSADLSGIGLYLRGVQAAGNSNVIIDHVAFQPGAQNNTHAPSWMSTLAGVIQVRAAHYVHRGAVINSGSLTNYLSYINGGGTPLYTLNNSGAGGVVYMGPTILDTFAEPCIANLGAQTVNVYFSNGACVPAFNGVGFTLPVTGLANPMVGAALPTFQGTSLGEIVGFAQDGIFNTYPYTAVYNNAAFRQGATYPLFIDLNPLPAPTASVSAGGTLALGNYTFQIAPIWQNGGIGNLSPLSAAVTTTNGNQTITINWVAAAGNPKDYRIFVQGTFNGWLAGVTGLAGQTSYVWTGAATLTGGSFPGLPAGGPTTLMPGVQGIATPALTLGGSLVTAPTAGTLAVSTGSPVSGNLAKYNNPTGSLIDSGVAASSLATVPLAVGNLSPGSNGQCVNTSGSAAVWGSCAGTAGEQLLSTNTTPVTANAATAALQTMQTATNIAAGALNSVGKTIRITASGSLNNVNGSETIALGITLAGFTAASNAVLPVVAANYTWTMQEICVVTTSGTSGNLSCFNNINIGSFTTGTTPYNFTASTNVPTNLTNALAISDTVSFTTASSSNVGTSSWLLVEQLN